MSMPPPPASRKEKLPALLGFGAFILMTGIMFLYQAGGRVNPFGCGVLIFLGGVYLMLVLDFILGDRKIEHGPVPLEPDWLTPVAIIWLTTCMLGPFFGYIVTDFPLWESASTNWRWQYGARVLLCIIFPLLSALPLIIHFARSQVRWVATPIIILITALPILTGANHLLDLREGTVSLTCSIEEARPNRCYCNDAAIACDILPDLPTSHLLYLPHTQRVLEVVKE